MEDFIGKYNSALIDYVPVLRLNVQLMYRFMDFHEHYDIMEPTPEVVMQKDICDAIVTDIFRKQRQLEKLFQSVKEIKRQVEEEESNDSDDDDNEKEHNLGKYEGHEDVCINS